MSGQNRKMVIAYKQFLSIWCHSNERKILGNVLLLHDRIQNKLPKKLFGRHGTARGLQTNKIGTVLCLAQCVIFNIVNGQLCPQSLCGWIGDCPGNERD